MEPKSETAAPATTDEAPRPPRDSVDDVMTTMPDLKEATTAATGAAAAAAAGAAAGTGDGIAAAAEQTHVPAAEMQMNEGVKDSKPGNDDAEKQRNDVGEEKPNQNDEEEDGMMDLDDNDNDEVKRSELKSGGQESTLTKDDDDSAAKGAAGGSAVGAMRRGGSGLGRRRSMVVTTPQDRQKVCPFLIRMFCKLGGHHSIEEFGIDRLPSSDETQVHTWKDASLRELVALLSQTHPEVTNPTTRISFRSAYQDLSRGGAYHFKDLGVIVNHRRGIDDDRSLEELRFVVGDYMDVAIIPHEPFANRHHNSGPDSITTTTAAAATSSSSNSNGLAGGMVGGRHVMRESRRGDLRHNPYGRPTLAPRGGGGRSGW